MPWRPVAFDEFVGDVGQGGVLDHRGRVQHAAQRQTRRGGRRDQPVGGVRLGDIAALHHYVRPDRADEFDGLQRLLAGL